MMPNSDLKLLGEKVRTERKLAGLTQEQLAERCHVSTKHIANIEKGSMNPSYEILLAIARVLPISLDALITPGMDKTEVELKEFNRIYLSCPEAVRETLMDSTRTLAKHHALSGCDLVALESNYDLHMLRSGRYPYYLRSRIESNRGHLSNDECSAKLLELIQEGCKKFALCHLSQENNTPALALQTMFNTLGAAGVVPEKDCIVQAQRRNEISPALTF